MNKRGTRSANKSKIAKYILEQKGTTKAELANELGLSMPTVLSSTKELMDDGIIGEIGEYESTGGRKAKALAVKPDIKYAAGIDITRNHITHIIINVHGEIIDKLRTRKAFENTTLYYEELADSFEQFFKNSHVPNEKLLGVGISLPGIIDQKNELLIRSHALDVSNINLQVIGNRLRFKTAYNNDANCAALAESIKGNQNVVFLSLKNTVGGSVYIQNEIYAGDNFRSGEFGHMVLVPDGETCYCNKKGCLDAYCAARVLSQHTDNNLEHFFDLLDSGDPQVIQIWDKYTNHLAVAVTNLRMAYDCNIILGGDVGAHMDKYMDAFSEKVMNYNMFDNDALYVKTCQYKGEASAVGIALTFIHQYFDALI